MSRIIVNNDTTKQELLWRHISIRKSLDEICHSLELEMPSSEFGKVGKHDRIEVRVENDLVKDSDGKRRITTVLTDDIRQGADTSRHTIELSGRSPARDIIDSAWSSQQDSNIPKGNTNLRDLITAVGSRFGIKCFTFPENLKTRTVDAFDFENESPWQKLDAEAGAQGLIFTSNEGGDLYLWQVQGAVTGPYFLTEGVNIKSVNWDRNGAEQFHEYIVTGGGKIATAIDDSCHSARILTIDIDDPSITLEKLERRATTEANRRREDHITCTVQGWGLTDTQIKSLGAVTKGKEIFWVPNILIPVNIPSLGLCDKKNNPVPLLVAAVEHEAAPPNTFETRITLTKRSAYL
jgi:prophage tail gpP-like protein